MLWDDPHEISLNQSVTVTKYPLTFNPHNKSTDSPSFVTGGDLSITLHQFVAMNKYAEISGGDARVEVREASELLIPG